MGANAPTAPTLTNTLVTNYSCVPIKRAGPIKQAGRNFQNFFKDEQALLSEQAGTLMMILKTSREEHSYI